MTGPSGNSWFCFPRISMFPEVKPRFEGNKMSCFPRDQSLSDLLYSWKFVKPRCNGRRWSTFTGNSALLPSDVIDFAMLTTLKFWWETVSLLGVMWCRRSPWERALLEKISNYTTILNIVLMGVDQLHFSCVLRLSYCFILNLLF